MDRKQGNKAKVTRPKKKKRQMILKPLDNRSVDSAASTVLYVPDVNDTTRPLNETLYGNQGAADHNSNASSSESEADDTPLREDMPVTTERWNKREVDALMDAVNNNRAALKYHFSGTGGGKDIRRQAWRDVALYVNAEAKTHRTVNQCSTKTSDFTQKNKQKYNKLRRELSKTGSGPVDKKKKLSKTQEKALEYLKPEAVRGIPGIKPMALNPTEDKQAFNEDDIWRPGSCDFRKVQASMKVTKMPRKDKDKEKRRKERIRKEERKRAHEKKMKEERRNEEIDARIQKEVTDKSRKKEEERKRLLAQGKQQVKPKPGQKVIKCTEEEWKIICADKAKRKAERAAIRAERMAKKKKKQNEFIL